MKTKFEFMKLCGVTLLWIGLAGVNYVPTLTDKSNTVVVVILGFMCFASGILMLYGSLKGEILSRMNHK